MTARGCRALSQCGSPEEARHEKPRNAEGQRPAHGGADGDDDAGAAHHGDAVGHDPVADEAGLPGRIECFQIVAVNGDVVGGGDKTAGHEEGNDQRDGPWQGRSQGRGQDDDDQHCLGDEQPLPFGAELINLRGPQKLDDPRQAEEGSEPDGFQAHAAVAKENRGNGAEDGVGEPLGEVDRKSPEIRVGGRWPAAVAHGSRRKAGNFCLVFPAMSMLYFFSVRRTRIG